MMDMRLPARRATRRSWAIAIAACVMSTLAGDARGLESRPGNDKTEPGQAITPQMGLDEALRAFERTCRAPDSAERFRALAPASAQILIKDLSALSVKLLADPKYSQKNISLTPSILPAYLTRQRIERWRRALPDVRPPEVSHQTFAVSLNGKAYVIAPGHGVRGDKRFYNPPKSDTAVRLATEAEGKHAIALDRRPSDLPGRLVRLEGKLPTGETVRFEAPAVQGLELLQALLPDAKMSFYNRGRGVDVDYARTLIFILPRDWTTVNRLRLHRVSGFSGAPAIEKTPEGDVIAGHFIGHRAIKLGGTAVTLGIIEDYDAIRSAVEKFAQQQGRATNYPPTPAGSGGALIRPRLSAVNEPK